MRDPDPYTADQLAVLAERHPALAGPAGRIEALLEAGACRRQGAPVAVLCHPHSLHGGSLHNKVVHMLARACRDLGAHALRFNFRGVGQSAGGFDGGEGETEDLLAVVGWVRERFPRAPLWLAGFSFGSAVALRGHQRAGAERLLLVAPPVEHAYFKHCRVAVPWGVMMGGRDEVVSPLAVSMWVSRQDPPPDYHYLEDASHFFHGRLIWLRDALKEAWVGAVPAACRGTGDG